MRHSEAPSQHRYDTVVRQHVGLSTSDVDSVIAKRLGVATSTVWKARTNRRGKSRRDSQIFVRCPVDVRTAIIEAAAADGVTMSAWVLRACERALEDV